ncbi:MULTISPECIES: flagellar hook-associated protein 2 [Brevibacillus]|uniref:flagellar hook-associated protein 2 n=1 Tax=Brevibacillus TaxID=55080 RepID=UPI001FA9F322|nr:flagellar hook-associated protein 2 [Brevibacillus borstelensis]MED1854822.1 flagellar hook-associated protein 2 [Brevibacillus borstelensis]
MSTMRISGLASGMDTEQMVKDLMKVRRAPLDKLLQKKQQEEWRRDSYREINAMFLDLKNKMFDMKLKGTYSKYKVTSSNESVVSAKAVNTGTNITSQMKVSSLAEISSQKSTDDLSADPNKKIDPNAKLIDEINNGKFKNADFGTQAADGTYSFTLEVFQPDGTMSKPTTFTFDPKTESLNDVLKKVNASGLGVTMFYDASSDKISMATNHTGDNKNGSEIIVGGNFLTKALSLTDANTGKNAQFTINGLDTERTSNTFTINGMEYTLKSPGDATVSTATDVDGIYDTIKGFVDKYNEIIEKVNSKLVEKQYRDYTPLLAEQKEEMSEKQIELWEEKAKSGLMRSDTILSSALSDMRRALYTPVAGVSDPKFDTLFEIGITTKSYEENGKLHIDEKKLREAISQNGSKVVELFTKTPNTDPATFEDLGIATRLYNSLNASMEKITEKAGSNAYQVDNSVIGKGLVRLNKDINNWEKRLKEIEARYWKQFTAMEQAIQKANSQSGWLAQQFGGGM